MRAVVDGLWEAFGIGGVAGAPEGSGGVSWAGFYVHSSKRPDELTLSYRRDKPACSPIGMHGACGQCFKARRPLVVTDVARLGAGYIACDPRDRAEVVLPLLNPDGTAWGVLDLDSFDAGAFDVFDALTLARLLHHSGLSAGRFEDQSDVIVV